MTAPRTAQDAALVAAVLRALKDLIGTADQEVRSELLSGLMGPGDRIVPRLPDGGPQVRGATVAVREGAVSARVTDEQALLAWVRDCYPTEVETVPAVERVRPAFREKLLAAAREEGEPIYVDGEMVDGLTVAVGQPTVVVSVSAEAAAEIGAHLRSGQLPLAALLDQPALPGPEVAS
jgi:hypothetical protein